MHTAGEIRFSSPTMFRSTLPLFLVQAGLFSALICLMATAAVGTTATEHSTVTKPRPFEVPDGEPFRSLSTATREDHDRMGVEYDALVIQKTGENLFQLLHAQEHLYLGAYVTLMEHNVQTASRALRAGEDDETVFVSLFHDVFEHLAVKSHGEVIAAMLAPYISPKWQWALAHHEIFQGKYYFDKFEGLDPDQRDMFTDNPFYNWTATWCEKYDQASFDPDYESLPLSSFEPIVERILQRPQYWWNPMHPKAGAIAGASAEVVVAITPQGEEESSLSKGPRKNGTCATTWTCYGDALEIPSY